MSDQLENTIEIRPAHPDDDWALTRLGQLDSAWVPPAPLLLALDDGELRAAISLATGAVIADPFAHTARLVELLRVRKAQERDQPPTRLRFPRIRRHALAWRPEAIER